MSTMRTAVMPRHAWKDRADDLYETPACATRALIRTGEIRRHGNSFSRIWEPCAGRGAIVRELKATGYCVVAHDLVAYDRADPGIETPIDFFLERKAPNGVGVILTNPPYKFQDEFIRHALFACKIPVVVLLRLVALEGAGRADLIDKHLRRVWAGIERLPGMHRDGWDGPKNNSGAPFAWFCFEPGERIGPIELRRMSWRE